MNRKVDRNGEPERSIIGEIVRAVFICEESVYTYALLVWISYIYREKCPALTGGKAKGNREKGAGLADKGERPCVWERPAETDFFSSEAGFLGK